MLLRPYVSRGILRHNTRQLNFSIWKLHLARRDICIYVSIYSFCSYLSSYTEKLFYLSDHSIEEDIFNEFNINFCIKTQTCEFLSKSCFAQRTKKICGVKCAMEKKKKIMSTKFTWVSLVHFMLMTTLKPSHPPPPGRPLMKALDVQWLFIFLLYIIMYERWCWKRCVLTYFPKITKCLPTPDPHFYIAIFFL